METGVPYRPQLIWVEQHQSRLPTWAGDAPRVYKAWKKVKYTVVADYYLTPTAVAFADCVLPMAMSIERDSYRSWWQPLRTITAAAGRYYECKMRRRACHGHGQALQP